MNTNKYSDSVLTHRQSVEANTLKGQATHTVIPFELAVVIKQRDDLLEVCRSIEAHSFARHKADTTETLIVESYSVDPKSMDKLCTVIHQMRYLSPSVTAPAPSSESKENPKPMTQLLLTDAADLMKETHPTLSENHTLGTGYILRTDQEQNLILWDACRNYHKGNPESVKANRRVDKVSEQRLILEALGRVKAASCERLEDLTFMKHQSCSPRLTELKRAGLIVVLDHKGRTRSGSPCSLYQLSEQGSAVLARQRPSFS